MSVGGLTREIGVQVREARWPPRANSRGTGSTVEVSWIALTQMGRDREQGVPVCYMQMPAVPRTETRSADAQKRTPLALRTMYD